MIKNNYSLQNKLSKDDLNLIHENTVHILENEGIIIDNKKALEVFKNNGIKIKDKKVYISRQRLEKIISKIPETFELKARNPEHNIEIGNDNSVLGPPLGPPFIYENEDKRYGTYEDYIELIKFYHSNPYIDLVGGDIIAPADIDKAHRHKKMFYAAAKYSDKALLGTGSGEKEIQDILNMGRILFGEDKLKNNYYILKLVGASSPLAYNNTALNTLINLAEYSQPIAIYSQILAGITGPITLAGLLTQQNAEILTGTVLAHLINSNTPVIYSTASSVTDMKSGNITVGNGQYAKIIAAVAQIADYYNLPSLVAGGVTDAKDTTNQAGFETMLNMYTSSGSGVDIIIYSLGSISEYLGVSYDKIRKDAAILETLDNFQTGIEVNKENIARKTIKEVGADNNFMTHPHTMERLQKRKGKKNNSDIKQVENYEKPFLAEKIKQKLQEI
ncbi:MAG: trimethylamine methyltransferase family protein [Halanaerobiales bacterium]